MWESIKNLFTGAKDALGIEIPELPVDLGGLQDSAATAAASVTETVNGATGAALPFGTAVTDSVADISQKVSDLP
ncbi:MAG: hypothetical protein VB093_10945 [Propionicimonas sp.]|uniref:hypothetical protein n=1 Tax=Propionibacterium freudenreichii TaxID=1744 RepID=UPI002B37554C|nr:hypothetical protein [Propionicimonas sp.]